MTGTVEAGAVIEGNVAAALAATAAASIATVAEGFPTLFLGAHREISGKIFLIFLKISHFSQNFSNF